MKPLTVAQADAMFEVAAASLEPIADYTPLLKALRYAPRGSNPTTWARTALRMFLHDHQFIKECQRLPALAIRSFFEQLPKAPTRLSVFLRVAVNLDASDAQLEKQWLTALECQVALFVTKAKGAESRRSKVAAIIGNAALLRAIQASVVNEGSAYEGELVVLTHDAGDDSLDALMPIFERAIVERDASLDLLRSLKTHATRTPGLDAMFERVDALFDERVRTSPGLEFAAEALRLHGIEAIYFQAVVRSIELTRGGVPRVECRLRVDSRKNPWFEVSADGTSGTEEVVPSQWPTWLEQVTRRAKVRWNIEATYVSGKHRARILKWIHPRYQTS